MPVAKAWLFIQLFLSPIFEAEFLPLRESLGRVLAADILSPSNVPNTITRRWMFIRLMPLILMSLPTRLKVIDAAFADKAFDGILVSGNCIRIMTGAAMPKGADTVVVQEKVSLVADTITFFDAPKPLMNVSYTGEDLHIGQTMLAAGCLMRAADSFLSSSVLVSLF